MVAGTFPSSPLVPESDLHSTLSTPTSGLLVVGQHRVEYIDMAGQEQFIDLEECAHNWVRWRDDHKDEFIATPGASEADITAENHALIATSTRRGSRWGKGSPVVNGPAR